MISVYDAALSVVCTQAGLNLSDFARWRKSGGVSAMAVSDALGVTVRQSNLALARLVNMALVKRYSDPNKICRERYVYQPDWIAIIEYYFGGDAGALSPDEVEAYKREIHAHMIATHNYKPRKGRRV